MSTLLINVKDKLEEAFCPTHLELRDDSHLHAGHAGVQSRGGSHLHLYIVSTQFDGLSTLKRHRLIYSTLAEELQNKDRCGIHALTIEALSPHECTKQH